jgi:hypothetical protein
LQRNHLLVLYRRRFWMPVLWNLAAAETAVATLPPASYTAVAIFVQRVQQYSNLAASADV